MTKELQTLIDRGASRPAVESANDTLVRFDTIQTQRWGANVK